MGKFRSRHQSRRPLIIRRSDLQSPTQRWVLRSTTAVFWMIWTLLWLPLITTLAWIFGGIRAEYYVIRPLEIGVLGEQLLFYGGVIFVLVGSLYLWAAYNLRRFRGLDRRRGRAAVTIEQVAQVHGVPPQRLAKWQQARVLFVSHDDEGRILKVNVGAAPKLPALDAKSGASAPVADIVRRRPAPEPST
ncbi:MAG: poly-beta-1,6-N-acetyl-D-glucosamine biosynthesis protein PgaD [Burkholderiaceae bacterium]